MSGDERVEFERGIVRSYESAMKPSDHNVRVRVHMSTNPNLRWQRHQLAVNLYSALISIPPPLRRGSRLTAKNTSTFARRSQLPSNHRPRQPNRLSPGIQTLLRCSATAGTTACSAHSFAARTTSRSLRRVQFLLRKRGRLLIGV